VRKMIKLEKEKEAISMYGNSVSISMFNKGKANKIFQEVNADGATAVLKNNKRIAVILSPAEFDGLIEKLEDYELMIEAVERINVSNEKKASMEDVMKKMDITQEDLDNTDVSIDI